LVPEPRRLTRYQAEQLSPAQRDARRRCRMTGSGRHRISGTELPLAYRSKPLVRFWTHSHAAFRSAVALAGQALVFVAGEVRKCDLAGIVAGVRGHQACSHGHGVRCFPLTLTGIACFAGASWGVSGARNYQPVAKAQVREGSRNTIYSIACSVLRPRQDSNLRSRLRRPPFQASRLCP
jgi:hypothetical protein